MKLSLCSAALAIGGALLAEAAPTPVQVIEVKNVDAFNNFRLGHAAAGFARPASEPVRVITITTGGPVHAHRPKKACGGMRMKAIELSNWFREKTGYPLIEPDFHPFAPVPRRGANPDVPQRMPHILPHPMPHIIPVTIVHGGKAVTPDGNYAPASFVPNREWYPHTFAGRLHKALITLGPWEGRAVAFVLGCGIGSLLRMVWVLLVVSFRSVRRREPSFVEEVVIFEEIEDHVTPPPPVYTDEKVMPEEKPTSA